LTGEDNPKLGDAKKRTMLLESVSAMSVLIAGADVVIMRHPESVALVREMIKELASQGG
jgi:acetyl-CoA decarbonylase/synthase complex subunit delta